MSTDTLRDRCCWKRCRAESDLIFMGAGLCDEHWKAACAVYQDTTSYIIARVIPAAASEIQSRRTVEATT